MLLSVLLFFLGILSLQQSVLLPSIWSLLFVLLLTLLLLYFKHKRMAFFLLGFVWAGAFSVYYLSHSLAPELQGKEILIEGHVVGLPEYNEQRVRFDFAVTHAAVLLPDKLRLSWYYPPQKVSAGQAWQFFVKLKSPNGTFNPGGFDYEKWLFTQHIGATGYIRQSSKAKLLATQAPWQSISVIRQSLIDLLAQQKISTDSLALIKALTLGDRSSLSMSQWQVLAQSGTAHLMAISGLHIGLVAGMIYWLAFQCWLQVPPHRYYSAPQIAAVGSFLAALSYAALAGFSVPTQRALVMVSVFMLTLLLRRHVKSLDVFAIAFLVVLLIDPMAVLSVGFYLSFLAVFCIIYVLSGRLGRESRWLSSLKLHVVVGLGLLPVLLFFFQQASLISPIANLIAIPIVSFLVVPLALLAVALLPGVPDISGFLLQIVDSVLHYLWQVLVFLVDLPLASIVLAQPELWRIIVAMLGVFLLLAPRGIPARYLCFIFILPLILMHKDKPEVGTASLTLLDVGQGLAVVVQTAKHTLVFDTGARFSDSFDMGRNVVLPFLHYQQITSVDTLVISHADNDHIGGAKSLLAEMPTKEILSSVPELLADYKAVACYAGRNWQWDQVSFYMLSPPKKALKGENDNSCVLKIETVQGSFLLTGDIENTAEAVLIEQSKNLSAEVLIAPHHGSKTSSSTDFLVAVNPSVILIPAASPNRFGFPHAQVIDSYNQLGASYFITGDSGALTVNFREGKAEVESYREKYRHYWNR
ncbi:MAG: DNA internalization-related competence protein ComEC/Rec2 [Methylococcaceae bacterium]|nr:DNA internalization-related competence protein ComEC/Rec2 [Methylococcaceae bacterium]